MIERVGFFLPLLLLFSPAHAQTLTAAQSREVVAAAADFVAENFYDPDFRGVDWQAVCREFEAQIRGPVAPPELRQMLRSMLAKLNNSHTGVITRAELQRIPNVLPFFFEKLEGRVYISYVFKLKSNGAIQPLEFGDEIVSVDDQPAIDMRPSEVTHLDDMMANPYTGEPGSVARIKLRRKRKLLEVRVSRVHRFNNVSQWDLRSLPSGGVYLRLLTLGQGTIPNENMPAVWRAIAAARYLILDLRHCVGGDDSLLSLMAGLFLGPGAEVGKVLQRGQTAADAGVNVIKSKDPGFRFSGRISILIDRNSESGPEPLAAALQDHRRAILIGSNSRGAWNGYSKATSLPHGIGMIGVPYTRSLSPKGYDYEGKGVPPNRLAALRPEDLAKKRDSVLDVATTITRSEKKFSLATQ